MTIGYLKCTICSLEIKWTRSDLLRVFEFMPNKDFWFKFPLPLIKNLSLIITIKINFISYFLVHELHICSVNEECFIHQQTKLYFYFSCGWYDISLICFILFKFKQSLRRPTNSLHELLRLLNSPNQHLKNYIADSRENY